MTLDDSVPTVKSPGCRPPRNMLSIVSGDAPSSKIVRVLLGLGLPTCTLPKLTPGGNASMNRSIALPLSGIWTVPVDGVGVGPGEP